MESNSLTAELKAQLEVRTRELAETRKALAEALEQQTATSEMLQVISSSPGELGPARELEVLVTQVVAPVKRRHSRLEGISSLSRDLTHQRAAALARAQDAVRSPRFRPLTLDIAVWLEAGQWTRRQDDLVRDRGDVAIETSAAEQLTRRFRKIRRQGKKLAPPQAPHPGEEGALRVGIFRRALHRQKDFEAAREIPLGARTHAGLLGRSQRHGGP